MVVLFFLVLIYIKGSKVEINKTYVKSIKRKILNIDLDKVIKFKRTSEKIRSSIAVDSIVVFLDYSNTLFFYNLNGRFKFFIDIDLQSPAYLIKNGKLINVFDNVLLQLYTFSQSGELKQKISLVDYSSLEENAIMHATSLGDTLFIISFARSEKNFWKKNIRLTKYRIKTKEKLQSEQDLKTHYMDSNGFLISEKKQIFLVSSFISKVLYFGSTVGSSFFTKDSINTDSAYIIVGNRARTNRKKKPFLKKGIIDNRNISFISRSYVGKESAFLDFYNYHLNRYSYSLDFYPFIHDKIRTVAKSKNTYIITTNDSVYFLNERRYGK